MSKTRWLARAAAAGALVVVFAGCSSSSKSSSVTSSGSSGTSGPAATSGASGSSGSGLSSQIASLQTAINGYKNLTFKAVYTATDPAGQQTITLEQAPPNSLFSDGSQQVITTSSGVSVCQTGTGCTQLPAGTASPSAALALAYSPSTALTAIQAWENDPGVTVASATIAGQPSTCVSYTGAGVTAKYCVTNSGILASESANGTSFTLTSYTTTVPASDFTVTPGPAIPSAP